MSEQTPQGGRGVVRRRHNKPAIPVGLRPAPSDDELETNVLERWQGWGLILTLFLALFLPAYWLFFENPRATNAGLKFRAQSIERGETIFEIPEPGGHAFQAGCAQCHGTDARGGFKANWIPPGSPKGTKGTQYPCPNLREVFKRQMGDQKKTPREAYRFVYETIAQGRPGTPMPTWGVGYGGPMNDQQIEDVINYLISIQENLPAGTKLAMGASRGGFSRLIAFGAEVR
ncbi:MAG: cytochrome c [Mycobacteriales bacterium]